MVSPALSSYIKPHFDLAAPLVETQRTDFTCGPAALLTAFRRLQPGRVFSPREEYHIWQKANSVHMGDGMPGCTHHGLAAAARMRGYSVEIISEDGHVIDSLFSSLVSLPRQKAAFDRAARAHRAQALEGGAAYQAGALTLSRLQALAAQGRQIVLLTRGPDGAEHWVVSDGVYIDDPCREYRAHYLKHTGSERLRLTQETLDAQRAGAAHMALAIGAPQN